MAPELPRNNADIAYGDPYEVADENSAYLIEKLIAETEPDRQHGKQDIKSYQDNYHSPPLFC